MTASGGSALRRRLGTAACLLLASGAPAHADTTPGNTLEAAALIYGERERAFIAEPSARLTRLFANGQSVAAQFSLDAMTGASPSGAVATNQVVTTTSASGNTSTQQIGQVPTRPFRDLRGALDLDWQAPVGRLLNVATSGHFSREKDYQSLGTSGKLSLDVLRRLVTLSAGGGYNRDEVFPVNGAPVPLSDGTVKLPDGRLPKRVTTAMVGISRILTRRWMASLNASSTYERGYLTEPYKVVSIVSPDSGIAQSEVTESRPGRRMRRDVLASSVYHLADDILYSSYRYYWDDWGVKSHTLDFKYRHDFDERTFLQPHVRLYTQSAADFFRFDVVQGEPLPAYVSADERLGPLHSGTVGATVGFQVPGYPGEFTVRAEYMRQWGDGHPANAIGPQKLVDLFPPVDIGSVVVGYTRRF